MKKPNMPVNKSTVLICILVAAAVVIALCAIIGKPMLILPGMAVETVDSIMGTQGVWLTNSMGTRQYELTDGWSLIVQCSATRVCYWYITCP